MSNVEFGYATAAEEAKRRLQVELVPGTEILRDRELTVHAFVHKRGRDDVILVPQPRDDTHDPLVRTSYEALLTRRRD